MKKILVFTALLLAVGGGCFFGGMKYGQSKTSFRGMGDNFGPGMSGNNATGTFPGSNRNGMGGMILGEITAKDSESITVKTQNGGTKIIYISDSAKIAKTEAGTVDDLTVGESITVSGTSNDDGSITAKLIQLNSGLSQEGPSVP
jgi:hypothetical protein